MVRVNCGGCGKMTAAGFLCTECVGRIRTILLDVPYMLDELRVALSRTARFTTGGGGSTGETPLPFNDSATRARAALTNTVLQWQAKYADHLNPRSVPANVQPPYRLAEPVRHPHPTKAALWIDDRIATQGVARWVLAPAMLRSLKSAHDKVVKAITPPPLRWYAGQCGDWYVPADGGPAVQCTHDLYADDRNGVMQCPHCGAIHQVYDRRATLLKEAEGSLVTAVEAAQAIAVWSEYERGQNHLAHHIVVWASRGRLEAKGSRIVDGKERPTYLLGDIRTLVSEFEQRMADRAARKKKS